MNTPTQEQIDKLPKWAKQYIKDLDARLVILATVMTGMSRL